MKKFKVQYFKAIEDSHHLMTASFELQSRETVNIKYLRYSFHWKRKLPIRIHSNRVKSYCKLHLNITFTPTIYSITILSNRLMIVQTYTTHSRGTRTGQHLTFKQLNICRFLNHTINLKAGVESTGMKFSIYTNMSK